MDTNITWIELGLSYILLSIPIIILFYYKTGLVKDLIIAIVRMTVQLIFIGFYLNYIFLLNQWWLNFAWIILMVAASSITIVKRSDLKYKYFIGFVFIGVLLGLLFTHLIFVVFVIGIDFWIFAQFLIPISGMIIGNCLSSSIIAIRSFYHSLLKEEEKYRYYLSCGATINEALFPFIRKSLIEAFNPTIANTATIGLIWIPGMMTGQILGGIEPIDAIKYQLIIMVAVIASGIITAFFSINLSKKFVFDSYNLLNKQIYK